MRLYRHRKNGKPVGVWWCDFAVEGRRVRTSTKAKDRRTAELVAARLLREAEAHGPDGSPHAATRTADPLALVADHVQAMRVGGTRGMARARSVRHVEMTEARLRRCFQGVTRLAEMDAERVEAVMALLVAEGKAASTVRGYRAALSGFFARLVRLGKWPSNPVRATEAPAAGEPTFQRRALSMEELGKLLASTETRGRYALQGLERATAYALAGLAGLRRGEIGALTWADVDLDASTLTVRASVSKSGREDVLPLHATAADLLVRLHDALGPRARPVVLRRVPGTATLYEDLKAAEIEAKTDAGRVDFHALRTSFVTNLARADVTLAQAQKLARHSTPALTANHYTKLTLVDGAEAVSRLALPESAVDSAAHHATQAHSALQDAPEGGSVEDPSEDAQAPESGAEEGWWRETDSNRRRLSQQIYSLPSLTT